VHPIIMLTSLFNIPQRLRNKMLALCVLWALEVVCVALAVPVYAANPAADANLPTAVVWYLEMAKNGDADAQYNLGSVYETGFGVKADPIKAVDWYTKAADQEHPMAQLKLGIMYILGDGIRQSTIKGTSLIERSAKNGNKFAAVLYKKVLSPDVVLDMTADEVLKVVRPYIDMGENKAIDKLTAMLKQDQEKAKSKTPQLAERFTSEKSKNALGKEINIGNAVPDFVDKKLTQVLTDDNIALLQRDADAGKADAQYQLGSLYDKGNKLEHDIQKAILWYTKAATQGNSDAEYRLAIIYIYGVGTAKDVVKGEDYLAKAAKANHTVAKKMLPIYMASRSADAPTSIVLSWYMEKIAAIDPEGLMGLGYMYENGWGIPENFSEAKKWYTEARLLGNQDAAKHLRQIKAEESSHAPDPSVESRPKMPGQENVKPVESPKKDKQNLAKVSSTDEKSSGLETVKNALRERSLITPLILIILGIVMGVTVFKWMRRGYKDSLF